MQVGFAAGGDAQVLEHRPGAAGRGGHQLGADHAEAIHREGVGVFIREQSLGGGIDAGGIEAVLPRGLDDALGVLAEGGGDVLDLLVDGHLVEQLVEGVARDGADLSAEAVQDGLVALVAMNPEHAGFLEHALGADHAQAHPRRRAIRGRRQRKRPACARRQRRGR